MPSFRTSLNLENRMNDSHLEKYGEIDHRDHLRQTWIKILTVLYDPKQFAYFSGPHVGAVVKLKDNLCQVHSATPPSTNVGSLLHLEDELIHSHSAYG